tara:strand:- start:1140 stop:2324 length:1185 start_codon:yes stop_codon:yes gene_type:complete
MKLVVIGLGYVGLSLACLFKKKGHEVIGIDIDQDKIDKINNGISPIKDEDINKFLNNNPSSLTVTNSIPKNQNFDFVIICTPTNYDEKNNKFDTSTVDLAIEEISRKKIDTQIIIKSTIPLGYTVKAREKYNMNSITFSPEFLREGKALVDNLYPSRIVVGDKSETGTRFANLLLECAEKSKDNIPVILMNSSEAEAVKLFANTYLAMRVAFFNELDSYCEVHDVSTKDVIKGVSSDLRIGNYYNNPSFGYGGYCLPKDTQQLLANYNMVPNNIIRAIVDANTTRKDQIAKSIYSLVEEKKVKNVGIFRLVMKEGSDNFRMSAVQGVMKRLNAKGLNLIVYEPLIEKDAFFSSKVISDLKEFKEKSDLIIANRMHESLDDVKHKIYTRDLFQMD